MPWKKNALDFVKEQILEISRSFLLSLFVPQGTSRRTCFLELRNGVKSFEDLPYSF
jgi:hypothetical protein